MVRLDEDEEPLEEDIEDIQNEEGNAIGFHTHLIYHKKYEKTFKHHIS